VGGVARVTRNRATPTPSRPAAAPTLPARGRVKNRARGGRFSKLPIIAITAKAMPDDQERCLQAGANDYIPKPLDVEMLLSLIRVWMPK